MGLLVVLLLLTPTGPLHECWHYTKCPQTKRCQLQISSRMVKSKYYLAVRSVLSDAKDRSLPRRQCRLSSCNLLQNCLSLPICSLFSVSSPPDVSLSSSIHPVYLWFHLLLPILVQTSVDRSLTTKSSSHVHLPHRLAPGHPDLQPQTRGADGAAPKEKTRIWGMGREMYREKSRKLDPKVCDEIKNRTALLPCYYIIFLQVRKNICHK